MARSESSFDLNHPSGTLSDPMTEMYTRCRTPAGETARTRFRVASASPLLLPARCRRDVVDAFFAAAREGDFEALVAVLDPEVVLRSDGGEARARLTVTFTGARTVAEQAVTFGRLSPFAQPALTNGTAGVVVIADGRPLSIMAFTVTAGKIATIEVLTDPDRLTHLDLSAFNQA